jgi:hypothetical protein
MTELGKKVWKKMEEMGWENAPQNFHLEYYENIIECTKQSLTEQLVCEYCDKENKPTCCDNCVDRMNDECID